MQCFVRLSVRFYAYYNKNLRMMGAKKGRITRPFNMKYLEFITDFYAIA